MKWTERYSKDDIPSIEQISEFIHNPLWDELCSYLQAEYGVMPVVQYSVCSGAPGWNVKYRKGGRALCTLYPDDGSFICLVTVGNREALGAELLLPDFQESIRKLYNNATPMNGARWLMISVSSAAVLENVKQLISLRVAKKRG